MALAAAQSFSATTLVTTAETTAISTPAVPITPTGQASTQPGTGGLAIRGTLNITPGTGTTSVSIRCHVGSLTGAHVEPAPLVVGVTAAVLTEIPFDFIDLTYSNAAQGYFITVQQAGASANGTVNQAFAEVDVMVP